jgi:hypothetical protein
MALRAPRLRLHTLRVPRLHPADVARHAQCRWLPLGTAAGPGQSALPPPTATDDEEKPRSGNRSMMHFRTTTQGHPLNIEKTYISPGGDAAWDNPTQNHVWSEQELQQKLSEQPKHKPQGVLDRVLWAAVRGAYHSFNFMTRYSKKDPSPASCEYRLLILESIAGVPGMVAGSVRHFQSLRHMRRDHGWIHTLLEEAENERMHLLICMKMFEPSLPVRCAVICAQVVLLPFLTMLYMVRPKALHRFVGYLEETAVETYTGILLKMDTEGSQLNKAWGVLPAPNIGKQYYKLSDDAMWSDVLRCIAADETNHRDVNHTFAGMKGDDPNPHVEKHLKDASKAWRLGDESTPARGL